MNGKSFGRSSPHPVKQICLFILTTLSLLVAAATGCNREPLGVYDVRMHRDIAFVERDGTPVYMNIAEPVDAKGERPAILWIHGGGWAGGARHNLNYLARYTASLGLVSASTDYRLTVDDHHFPDQLHDVAAAYDYLCEQAEQYHIDTKRILVGGDSAGGHLALLLGLCSNRELMGRAKPVPTQPPIAGVINIYGPTDLRPMYTEDPTAFILQSLLRGLMDCKLPEEPERWKAASPVAHLSKSAPPIITIHGEFDSVVPYEQAVMLDDACQKLGVEHNLIRVPLAEHGFVALPRSAEMASVLPVISHFIGKTVGG